MALVVVAVSSVSVVVVRRGRSRPGVANRDPRRALTSVAMHLARATRAGTTPSAALAEAAGRLDGPVGRQLRDLERHIGRGTGLEASLQRWSREAAAAGGRRGAPDPDDVQLLAAAVAFSTHHGSGLAEAFEGVAVALVDRAELLDEVAALTSQARASIAVLCALPVLGAVLVGAVDPSVPAMLLRSPAGVVCLLLAVALDLGAVVLGTRLTRIALR